MQAQVDLNDKSRNQMLDCRSKVIPNLDSLLKLLILTNIEDFFKIQENYQNTAEITTICKILPQVIHKSKSSHGSKTTYDIF